ncbi:MAG TPA: hypothetical protein VKR55_02360 [Bradyrhizobium sp.]|uniref:hypothetical protein n=1 Tax=Bradyrhizobium sp. TaxID=376 RepID=UPI002C1C500B|nr:hypothetical protein [Bradyrhizobium sp.]HLZ00977.1 hypothetical protein [Bradyrhizobium sp.]
MARLAVITQTVVAHKWRWLAITTGFVAAYYAALVASVVISFGELPNYVRLHDFVHNVVVIIRSTPSIRDMIPIALDEWLLEIGYMNRDYGHGISEWSVELIPSKLLIVVALGALVATNVLLLQRRSRSCPRTTLYSGATATGLGAALVGFTSITMMWVVCCASPTWVVGLTLLGVGVSTAFGLQPFGADITLAGFGLLVAADYALAGDHPIAFGGDAAAPRRLAQHQA